MPMSMPPDPLSPDRRTRKRLATRDAISNAATRLFFERGFEQVTVDQIAEAADVGRMTVFNHFPRKEDMFFDRDAESRDMLRAALRGSTVPPVEALRQLAHRLVAENSPYVGFSEGSLAFLATIERSETLKARARAIRDEVVQFLAEEMAVGAGRAASDPDAQLAAGLLLATWTAARSHAYRIYMLGRDNAAAHAAFLAVVDKGSLGITAALAGTPFGLA